MANKKDIQKLQSEFPDLSQSVLGDVLNTYKNDKDRAANALRGISDELKQENNKKIQELKEMFPSLPLEVISTELEACKGDVDATIAPLFSRAQEQQQKEKKKIDDEQRRKQKEEEIKRRKEDAKKQANNLMDIFKNIPPQKVQELLDEHEGDIEETTAQLLKVVAKQEDDKKVAKQKAEEDEKRRRLEQEKRMKDLKFQALKDKFEELADNQVNAALETNDWDIKRALAELYRNLFRKEKEGNQGHFSVNAR